MIGSGRQKGPLGPVTVGIGGGTGAGKSSLVRGVVECLGDVSVLDLDSYYLDRYGVPPAERDTINFDDPEAFDIELLLEHVRRLRQGEAVEKPRYSFTEHVRQGSEAVAPAPVILLEGLFALWWEGLRSSLDLKVFVDAPADVRLARRIQRDTRERGRSVDSVVMQYLGTVRAMHERYIEPTRLYADVVLRSDGPVESTVGALVAILERKAGT